MREILIKVLEKLLVVLKRTSSKFDAKESSSPKVKIESALESEQQLFFEMLDNLPILFHLQSPDYSIPYANKMFREVFGEPSGKTCHETMHGRDLPCEECTPFKIMQTGKTEEHIWQTPNGKTYMTVMTPFKSLADSNLVMEMAIDITALKETEKELRTPLNGIIGFSGLILNDKKNPLNPVQKKDIEHVCRSGQHLLNLINGILDISQVESGNTHVEIVAVEVSEIVYEVLSLMNSLAVEKSVNLVDTMKDQQKFWVKADAFRLKQVLINLVVTAIQYNKENGTVKLSCENQPANKLRIKIEDTGRGIPYSQHSKLFDPFNRTGFEFKTEEGMGLGLPISKELVELMGGELDFSTKVGEGSCFFTDLPTCQDPGKYIDPVIHPIPVSKSQDIKFEEGIRILYIEDNKMNRHLLDKFFKVHSKYHMLEASNAKEGIRLARKIKPDLILMDINLPGISGVDAFKILKQHKDTKNIPVVALSANVYQQDIDKTLALGFYEYLTKPVDFNRLITCIQEVLSVNRK